MYFNRYCAMIVLGRIVPVFMSECALDYHRGFIGSLSTLCFFLWDPIALILAQPWALGTEELWPLLVAYPAIPSLFCICFVAPMLHESPKYLHIIKQNKPKAIESLKFYHGKSIETKDIIEEYQREHDLVQERMNQPIATFSQIFSASHLRRSFLVAVMAIISITIVGESLCSQYSTRIFESAGLVHANAVFSSLLAVLPGLFAMVLATILIDRLGRRPLILSAMVAGVLANLLLSFTGDSQPVAAVFGIVLIKIAHDGGAAPVGHLIPGDVCPQAIRYMVKNSQEYC